MLLGLHARSGGPRLAADDVVDRREAHDLVARDLPCLLDDPREGPVLPVCLFLDLPQHVLREIEALLSLVRTRHQPASGLPRPRRVVRRAINSTFCLDLRPKLVKRGLCSLSVPRTGDSYQSYRVGERAPAV